MCPASGSDYVLNEREALEHRLSRLISLRQGLREQLGETCYFIYEVNTEITRVQLRLEELD